MSAAGADIGRVGFLVLVLKGIGTGACQELYRGGCYEDSSFCEIAIGYRIICCLV